MADTFQTILSGTNADDSVKAQAWELSKVKDRPTFESRLKAMPLSDPVKAQLWEAQFGGSTTAPSATAAPETPGYASEILGGIRRGFSALAGAPSALLNTPDTHYTPKTLEDKLPIVPRILFNIPATIANTVENATAQAGKAKREGEGLAGQILAYGRELPVVGGMINEAEKAGSGTQVGPVNVNVSPQNIGAATEGIIGGVVPLAAGETLNRVGKLREAARNTAQGKLGASAFDTTEKTVAKYNADAEAAKAAQTESDAKIAQKNLEAEQEAQAKTAKVQQSTTVKNEAAMNEADIKTEQRNAAVAEANARAQQAHTQAVADAQTHNATVVQTQAQADDLDTTLKQGSSGLGQSVADLNAKLREEGNAKYAEVRNAVAEDPGVPMAEMAQAAKEAEAKLKGSTENIKQFRELIRKAPEDEGVIANGVQALPGDPIYEMLKSQGALETSGNLPFDQLQGYSSEIGQRLASGNLPGDVYQALKYLKEKIDAEKTQIAERNGVGEILKSADAFWHDYNQLFYDKDSAVAQVRERVGTLDPQFYSEPFTKGKASGVAAERLRKLETQHAPDAAAIADLGQSLRDAYIKRRAIGKIPALKPIPEPPAPKNAGPRSMAVLQPLPGEVAPEVTPRKVIPGPDVPTAEGIVADKAQRAKASAYGLGRLNKYDVGTVAAAAYALSQGDMWTAAAIPAIRFGVPSLLKTDGFIDFISQPTEADIAAASKLPEPARSELQRNLRRVIDATQTSGKPLPVAPAVQRLIQTVPLVSNRRDALQTLGRPTP